MLFMSMVAAAPAPLWATPLLRWKVMASLSQSRYPSRATGEVWGAEPKGSGPSGPLHSSGSGREQADLSAVLSSWARVFLSLTIYTGLTIYTWLVFFMHLISPLFYIIFLVFFLFLFSGLEASQNTGNTLEASVLPFP